MQSPQSEDLVVPRDTLNFNPTSEQTLSRGITLPVTRILEGKKVFGVKYLKQTSRKRRKNSKAVYLRGVCRLKGTSNRTQGTKVVGSSHLLSYFARLSVAEGATRCRVPLRAAGPIGHARI